MSEEKKSDLKETPVKKPDATSPTEALNDAVKGVDLGNKVGKTTVNTNGKSPKEDK